MERSHKTVRDHLLSSNNKDLMVSFKKTYQFEAIRDAVAEGIEARTHHESSPYNWKTRRVSSRELVHGHIHYYIHDVIR